MKRSCLLFIVGVISIFGFSASAYADPVSGSDSTQFTVTVNEYLNLALSATEVSLPIVPSSAGTFGERYFTATSSTNNAYGYSLNLTIRKGAASDSETTTNLTSDTRNVNDGTFPVIPTFSTNDELTSAQFSASTSADHLNHWAVSIDDTDHYKKVLADNWTIASSDAPIADDVTTINAATKLDLLTPPGSYSAYFNFQIVANPAPVPRGEIETKIGEITHEDPIDVPVCVDENDNITESGDDDTATCAEGSTKKTFSIYKMQSMTPEVCAAVTTPTEADFSDTPTAQLVDVRDKKVYWVAKLMDGKCWMTQNLDLVLSSVKEYTNSDTDIGWNGTSYSSASWTPVASTLNARVRPTTGWEYDSQYEGIPHSADVGKIMMGPTLHSHVGNYYNLAAAVARNDIGNDVTTDVSYNTSICPRGWKLPTISYPLGQSETDDYSELVYAYGWQNNASLAFSAPFYAVSAGNFNSNNTQNLGQRAQLISNSETYDSGSSNTRYLYIAPQNDLWATQTAKIQGMSIRCVAR